MEKYNTQESLDSNATVKISSDLCIPPNQSDSILVQVKLPNNEIISTNFALWNTILDVKRYILPAIQSKIANIQQIKCVFCDSHNKQFEANDHTLLKYYWANNPLQVLVNIEHHEDIKNTSQVSNIIYQQNIIHPEQGNILDTNFLMPKHPLGYRNKKTGKFYKSITIQTSLQSTDNDCKNTNSTAIQTISTQNATTEVVVESGTQTESMDFLRSLNIVREISCHPKMISNPIENLDKYARIIQKSVRSWIARKKFENMLKYYYDLKQLTLNEEKNLKNIVRVEKEKNVINLAYPTKTKDFEAIYSIVHDKFNRVKINEPKSKKIALLKEEFTCLKEIEKYRTQIKKEAEEKKVLRQLNEISKPIVKIRKNGELIYIETPETCQAKQFMDLYVALKKNVSSKSERIELLLKLRDTIELVKETDLTKSLIDLITRELTILNVFQLNNDELKILRKRIEIEFQRILKQPDINPAIARTSKAADCLFKCYNCVKLKPVNKFVVLLNLSKPIMCKDCRHLNRITTEQVNLIPHENILKNIRATEAKMGVKSSLSFFLRTEDIYYLVTIIWKAKSAISESKDISQLKLVRWNNEKYWSPFNTILLTIEEAYVHSKIRDINKAYSTKFINEIHLKHVVANKYFKYFTTKTEKLNWNN